MEVETEVKIKIEDPNVIREKIIDLGLTSSGKVIEKNIMYDTPEKSLKKQGKHLRIRDDGTIKITFKGPVKEHDYLKIRDEPEIIISDKKNAEDILIGLGFIPQFVYEKERETFKLKDGNGEVVIDKLPFLGYFIEIESSESIIEKLIVGLGLKKEDAIKKGYIHLFMEYKKENNLDTENMTFDEEIKNE